MYPWTFDSSCTQIRPVLLFALLMISQARWSWCWTLVLLVDLTDLGINRSIALGWIPEQLMQVIPKSDKYISLLCWQYLKHGVQGVDHKCWLVDLTDVGINWAIALWWIPKQLTQVIPKSDQSFSMLCWWYLRHGVHGVDPKCWLVDLTDLGIKWVIASGWIPEQLTQVIPKSDK